jgi:O-antigen ligase
MDTKENLNMKTWANHSWIFPVFFFLIFPFIFLPYLQDQDFLPKHIAIAVNVIFISIVLLIIKKKNYIFKSQATFLILSVFFLLSTLLSFGRALNSEEALAAFLISASPFLLLFVLLTNKGLIDIYKFAFFSSITILGLAVIVLSQMLYAFISEDNFVINYAIRATLSNKNFVSESLVMLLPLSLSGIVILNAGKKKLAIIASIVAVLLILLLQTISAWLALIVSGLILLIGYKLLYSKSSGFPGVKSWKLISVGAFIVLGVVFLFSVGYLDPVKTKFVSATTYISSDFGERIQQNDSANVNSVFERFLLWRNSLKLSEEYTLTGVGLSNWRMMYSKYGIGGAYHLNSGIMHFEHPHNEYLLLLSETGVVSLVAFLSLIIFIILIARKNFKDPDNGKVFYLMFSGIVSFTILAFFGYPMHRPLTISLLIIIFGIILTLNKEKKVVTLSRWPVFFVLVLSIINLRVLIAREAGSEHMAEALHEQSKGRFRNMLKELNSIDTDYLSIDNTGTPVNWYKGFAHYHSGLDSSLYFFEMAERQNPYHLQVLSDLGAAYENNGHHEKAIEVFLRVLKITPRYENARLNLAVSNFNSGKIEIALANINLVQRNFEYKDKVLEAILKSYVDSMLMNSKDVLVKNCLNEILVNKSEMIRLNNESVDQNVQLSSLLLNHCK